MIPGDRRRAYLAQTGRKTLTPRQSRRHENKQNIAERKIREGALPYGGNLTPQCGVPGNPARRPRMSAPRRGSLVRYVAVPIAGAPASGHPSRRRRLIARSAA